MTTNTTTIADNEAAWENYTLDLLARNEWDIKHGTDIAPGTGQRENWAELVLRSVLDKTLLFLNPDVPQEYLRQAADEVLSPTSQDAITENHRIHTILLGGYRGISYIDADGQQVSPVIRFLSPDVNKNTYTAVNQVTLRSHGLERRFDVVCYVNGMPLAFFELKDAASRSTPETAYNQLQTYLNEFPLAFRFARILVASDGINAQYGTPFTPWNHYAPWNVDDDGRVADDSVLGEDGQPADQLDLLIEGVFNLERFRQLITDFIAYDESDDGLAMRIAKPHQYFAVTKAVASTVHAVDTDGRAGVVWHTQGSGKSMEMELYTAKVMQHPRLANPTVIVVTDRTELDGQLFDSFQTSTLLPEAPTQIGSREELRRELTSRRTGGILFTTLQKFGLTADERAAHADHPMLSDRRNVIVMADEAHRSHYDNINGYAAHLKHALPHATLIAFTGTPIAEGERDTRRVFGDDIDIYDLNRAVADGATVPVYVESRLISLVRPEGMDDATIDAAAEDVTEGLDDADRDRLQRSAAVLDTIYGAPARLTKLADDLIAHWEDRREAMRPFIGGPGKAMIVCATREICARLYDEIVHRRPDWHDDALDKGRIKVVYTATPGDSDLIKKHLRRPSENAAVKKRVKNADDELELVIVQSMMLTGFDAPALHTLYLDRPIKGALLMQTLARVNRTYRGKQDGLLVAYAPLIDNLAKALSEFTSDAAASGKKVVGQTADEAEEIVRDVLVELDALVNVDWRSIAGANERSGMVTAIKTATTKLRSPRTPGNTDPQDPLARPLADSFREQSAKLARAAALAGGTPGFDEVRPAVKFYESVRMWMAKLDAQDRLARGEPIPDDVRRLLGELVVTAAETDGVIDIYAAAGLDRPSLGELTPAWQEQATAPDKAQLAIEGLRADILRGATEATHGNTVRNQMFSERINNLMIRYTNQQLTAAEVIAEMMELAKDVVKEADRGKQFTPPLQYDELAFYDMLVRGDESAVDIMGSDTLATIARELVERMRKDIRTDWTVRDDVKAKMRATIKRLLRKYKYPPNQQKEAIIALMNQMEAMAPRYAEVEVLTSEG
ncbi:MAG: type I restriction endonuclease subunit R [Corynebacterium variabile]|uniref:type I restriction endonuclease subunit R n=1 Tax=Corynebacterium variabile TaxID=1727 RepID=UPI003F8F7580